MSSFWRFFQARLLPALLVFGCCSVKLAQRQPLRSVHYRLAMSRPPHTL